MKNLKKLSRIELKNVSGGKGKTFLSSETEGCADMCTPTGGSGDSCAQFGLTCGFYQDSNGNWCNRCL
ncbi:hypothetical protein [uncultured Chryseobacterium sp.]|uniref:bacteriocin-like protein n=1 Tax=uncultured Chryseobacterium sp. TaxID=259322 RepID=UPI0025E6F9AA|nr:hypothetical protein [uncultured Chryseobacterium sp.]